MIFKVAALALGAFAPFNLSGGQEPEPPVPYLNFDGTVPKGQESHTVFLDRQTGDAVAIYRTFSGGNSSGSQTRVKVPLSRNVDPSIAVAMEYRSESAEFRYLYVLRNGPKARQPASIWFFVGLVDPKEITVEHPPLWLAHFPDRLSETNIALRSLGVMVRNPPVGSSVAPNVSGVFPRQERSGLVFVSKRLPGVIEVYVQGRSHIAEFPDEPPDTVTIPLASVTGFPFNYRRTLALGPKYAERVSRTELAERYAKDLDSLADAGLLDRSGSFFSTARALFLDFRAKPISKEDLQKLNVLAKSPKEKELASAIELAFF